MRSLVDGRQMERVTDFKYLGAKLCKKLAKRREVAGVIRSLVNGRGLKLDCTRVLA